MVQFSSYVTPMDRDYGKPTVDDSSTNDVGIGVQDIGWGLPMGIGAQNIQGIAAKIREGAGNIEIQFAGTVTGQRQAQTPGMYGKEQREAMRELAEINEINLTTHAGFGIMGLAGMDQRSGNFSKEYRKTAIDEIKRAVEFAADAAKGGSVVVHTGEFQRPISEEEWAQDPSGKQVFTAYEEEPEHAVIRVVDDRTGQVMTQVRKNEKVPRPIWLRYNEDNKDLWEEKRGKPYTDEDGKEVKPGDYVDYEGNHVDRTTRVPVFDPDTGRFKVDLFGWEHFEGEAKEINKAEAEKRGMTVAEFKLKHPDEYVEPEEAFLRATLEANEGHARGWALQYASGFDDQQANLKKLKKALVYYEKLEAAVPEEERWRIAQRERTRLTEIGLVPEEYKLPTELIKDALKDTKKSMEYSHEASVSQQQLAEQSRESQEHVKSVRKYALGESFKSYAEAGIHAMDQTRAKKEELEQPVFVTMENIYPESFGSHPDELKELVLKSREKMVEMITSPTIEGKPNNFFRKGVSEQEAKKLAETHLKATLDVGHLNVWRKYWQNDPGKTIQENDADFKKWMLDKTEDLAKHGIVGNVHLADNYGYQDEHLTPGEGTAPIKEMVAILRKHGYKGPLTVEAGSAATTDVSDFHGLMKTWKLFGSPVYGAHGPVARMDQPKASWSDIQYSYFGQTAPPYYVFGPYAPSQDWTLWSQVPME
jgi:sugar phosphate isomerase/epimerase